MSLAARLVADRSGATILQYPDTHTLLPTSLSDQDSPNTNPSARPRARHKREPVAALCGSEQKSSAVILEAKRDLLISVKDLFLSSLA